MNVETQHLISKFVLEAAEEMPKTCRHEAVHILYSKRLGFDPELLGPALLRREGKFWFRLAAVEFLPEQMQMEADPVAVAKTFLGPICLGLNQTDTDIANFVNWYARRFPSQTKTDEKYFLTRVMESVRADAKQSNFQTELQSITAEVREALGEIKVEASDEFCEALQLLPRAVWLE
jgi:hypothetical protein